MPRKSRVEFLLLAGLLFPEQARKKGVSVDALLLDGMHPNDVGHRIVADLLRERIRAMAAAPPR